VVEPAAGDTTGKYRKRQYPGGVPPFVLPLRGKCE
jgi:hypothetical protein